MLIIDTLLIGGIRFVLDKIAAAVEAELYDDTALKEELLAAQMRLEMGELTEEQFAQIERRILEGIRVVRARRESDEAGGELRITGVDASVWTGDQPDDDGRDAARR